MLHYADDSTFASEVLQHQGPVLVEFFTQSCVPCRRLEPLLRELASNLHGRLKVVKIDSERALQTAQNYGVRMAPTLMIFQHGEPRATINGMPPANRLQSFVQPFV